MQIHTVNFGSLEIPEESIITFKEGLPGFPQIHRFAVLEMEELKPFQYLQALDDPPISLFVINPFIVDPSYEFRLTDSDMEDVNSTNSAQLAVYAVATIPEDPNEATINLMAPIVINEKGRCGKQVILHESKYSVKHPVLQSDSQSGTLVQEA
ncbi:MAG: flagellar assembly protein FliW [Acidobacteria bacterium]|nr:flagellar assembly protein FliW [Acidobacteriota bacterium]